MLRIEQEGRGAVARDQSDTGDSRGRGIEIIDSSTVVLPPDFAEPTSEELARRQRLIERAHAIREKIRAEFGPLDITTGELKRLARGDADWRDDQTEHVPAKAWQGATEMQRSESDSSMTTRERVVLPDVPPVSEDEKARQRKLIEEARRIREQIGPISVPTYVLVREGRDEDGV